MRRPGRSRWWTTAPSRVCSTNACRVLADAGSARTTERGSTPRARSASPVCGQPSGLATEQALHRDRRECGEQADAVQAVLAQRSGLLRPDAVQCLHRQRPKPADHLAGTEGQNTARGVDPTGGGLGDGDGGADADAYVDAEPRQGPHPQHLTQAPGVGAAITQRTLQLDQSCGRWQGLEGRGEFRAPVPTSAGTRRPAAGPGRAHASHSTSTPAPVLPPWHPTSSGRRVSN